MESLAGAPDALEGLAVALHGQGAMERALHVWAHAQAIRSRTGAIRGPYNDRWVVRMLGALWDETGAHPRTENNASSAALTNAQLQAMIAELIRMLGQE
jgi:hypothetical protein